ncbi:Hypothetical protein YqcC [Salmonella enterica subsp. enterica serovar Montevideo str. S5-403]|uniref:YqcC-like domain-containing protein n=1 Tax=Salmonella enterica subsp. enterica serovar Montevideo str. S5-403 TaxID=913242 RepID=G5Q784_SALMO|nr:Hypothetical protein YqcC [Salmonella enterica subsp. enterica serovar Montevideo str. S5-403]
MRLKRCCASIATGLKRCCASIAQAHLFTSTQPFFMDTMEPLEWLQWVLIPRMHTLLDNAQPLPEAFAVAPYYEMALAADHPQREAILAVLQDLDALFVRDKS